MTEVAVQKRPSKWPVFELQNRLVGQVANKPSHTHKSVMGPPLSTPGGEWRLMFLEREGGGR